MINQFHNRRRPIPLPLQYSAEIVRSDGERGKVYLDGGKRRVELTVNGVTQMAIWRPDLGEYYSINLEAQTYTAHTITAEMAAVMSADVEDDVEWEYVAAERVGSHAVDVYDVFARNTELRRARVYVDSETHIRRKEVTFNDLGEEVLIIENTNVKTGPPSASVFELPPGLRRNSRAKA
ncbi:MAG TPA: hypothetical protein VFW87_07725 [Pirellulales bacterium]|nr:hypothetical protein [Pirellulales bacterium]